MVAPGPGGSGEGCAVFRTGIRYLRPEGRTLPDTEGKATAEAGDFGKRADLVNLSVVEEKEIFDARPAMESGDLSLDTSGFILLQHQTKRPHFGDTKTIEELYYPEVIDLVKRVTGAQHALVSAHRLAQEDDPTKDFRALVA